MANAPITREYNQIMLRMGSMLLLVCLLPPFLEAQRGVAGFGGFGGVPAPVAHTGHGFSNSQFRTHFRREGFGALWSPYFLASDEPYLPDGGTEADGHARRDILYSPPERNRPVPDAQVIEIPAGSDKAEKPPLPAIFVLRSGERLETERFLLTVNNLSVSVDRHERVIPLDAVDLGATVAANRERGINLRIPAERNEISLSF